MPSSSNGDYSNTSRKRKRGGAAAQAGEPRPQQPPKTKDPLAGLATRRAFPVAEWYKDASKTAATCDFSVPVVVFDEGAVREAEDAIDFEMEDINGPDIDAWRGGENSRKALAVVLNQRRSGIPVREAEFWNKGFRILAERAHEEPPEPELYDVAGEAARATLFDMVTQRGQAAHKASTGRDTPSTAASGLETPAGTPASGASTESKRLYKHKVRPALLDRTGSDYKRKVGRPTAAQVLQARMRGVTVESLNERAPVPTESEISTQSIETNLKQLYGEERATKFLESLNLDPTSLLQKAKEEQDLLNKIREQQSIRPKSSKASQKTYYYNSPEILDSLVASKALADSAGESFDGQGLAVLNPRYRRFLVSKTKQTKNFAPPPPLLPRENSWSAFEDPAAALAHLVSSENLMGDGSSPMPPALLQVNFMNPETPMKRIASFQVADNCFLSDFVDILPCHTEMLSLKPISVRPGEDGSLNIQKIHRGETGEPLKAIGQCFLFAEGAFFVDNRAEGWREYIAPIVSWVDAHLPEESRYRPLKIGHMSSTTFASMELRINHPYLFVHGKNHLCQHRVIFTQIHLGPAVFSPLPANETAPLSYPVMCPTYIARNYSIGKHSFIMFCTACNQGGARYLAESDPLSDTLPSAWCEKCFAEFHGQAEPHLIEAIRVSELSFHRIGENGQIRDKGKGPAIDNGMAGTPNVASQFGYDDEDDEDEDYDEDEPTSSMFGGGMQGLMSRGLSDLFGGSLDGSSPGSGLFEDGGLE